MKKPKTDVTCFQQKSEMSASLRPVQNNCFIPFVNIHFVKTKLTLSDMIQYMLGCFWKTNENIISNV